MACDPDLIRRARLGDTGAFDLLIGPLVKPAYRLAATILLDPAAAEDAVQEAALRAWRKLGRLREDASLRSWFFSIVARQCLTTRRSAWWSVVKGIEDRFVRSDPDATIRIDLERGLANLSASDRALLVLHYFHDLPLDEAGAILGLSPAAAKSRVYRAIRRLRPELALSEVNS